MMEGSISDVNFEQNGDGLDNKKIKKKQIIKSKIVHKNIDNE